MKTSLTEFFGIEHPIVSGPMALISGGRLAAAVTSAAVWASSVVVTAIRTPRRISGRRHPYRRVDRSHRHRVSGS